MTEVAPNTAPVVAAPTAAPVETAPEPAKVKTLAMELKRHYVPHDLVRIVGYQKAARVVKNAGGERVEVEPARFVDGEMYPPIFPGVGFDGKIWAGTVIEVPEAEAKTMRLKGIAEAYI